MADADDNDNDDNADDNDFAETLGENVRRFVHKLACSRPC